MVFRGPGSLRGREGGRFAVPQGWRRAEKGRRIFGEIFARIFRADLSRGSFAGIFTGIPGVFLAFGRTAEGGKGV